MVRARCLFHLLRAASRCYALLGLLLCLWARPLMAADYTCSQTSPANIDIGFPGTIAAPRNAPNGTALTGWVNFDKIGVMAVCSTTGAGAIGIWIKFLGENLTDSGVRSGGYVVWNTGTPGVGIAIRTSTYVGSAGQVMFGCKLGWLGPDDLAAVNVNGKRNGVRGGCTRPANNPIKNTFRFGGSAEAMLVKTGVFSRPTTRRKVLSLRIGGTTSDWYGGGGYDRNYYLPGISVVSKACSTPDVTVALGDHRSRDFPQVGSQSNPVKFALFIRNCPAGLSTVKYGFNSPTTDYSAKDGTVGLRASATAKGLKVKLLNADGTAVVALDKWYTLSSYNASRGGDYSVGLSAVYVRTGTAEVTAGTANAELTIAMSYD